MTNNFKIALFSTGPDPDDWTTLTSLLSAAGKLVDPDWTFTPFSKVRRANSGKQLGLGFPAATWKWNVLADWQREALRAFCPSPALSATVYIRTPLNETSSGVKTWGNFQTEVYWPSGDEDKQNGKVLGLILEFRHMIIIPEYEL